MPPTGIQDPEYIALSIPPRRQGDRLVAFVGLDDYWWRVLPPDPAPSTPMKLDVHAAAMTFSDGSELEVAPSTVTFVVGANNSGKSRMLVELRELLASGTPGVVLNDVRRGGVVDGQAISQWLDEVAYVTARSDGHRNELVSAATWPNSALRHGFPFKGTVAVDGPLYQAAQLLVQNLGASERQQLVSPQGSFDWVQSQPSTALQVLQADPVLEMALSEMAESAFGRPVTLNRVAGPNLRLHVGRPSRKPDLMDVEYAKELAALPSVDEQGDGYKAFLGVMLSVLVGRARVLMIDEPEAFCTLRRRDALGANWPPELNTGPRSSARRIRQTS